MYTASATNSKKLVYITQSPNLPNTVLHRSNLIKSEQIGQKCTVEKNWQEDPPPLANGALCLSTPKHNGKSGTDDNAPNKIYNIHQK